MAPESRQISITRAAGAVSIATAISRVLGLAREMTIAALFPKAATDAFFTAFRIPNLLRDLLAEGALSAAFLPTYADLLEKQGRREAFRLASSVVNGLLIVTGLFALSVVLFARLYALSLASGFDAETIELTALLARIMAPFLTAVAIAAVLMGIGNAHGRFFVPALAPALFNVGVLAGGWLIAPWLEARGWPGVTGLAAGAVLGGLLQLAIQFPGVIREGFTWRPVLALADPAVRRVMGRMAPATFGVAATYINVVVDNQMASYYGSGPVSYLFYAFRLWMLPIGVFGVAIATANLAGVARDAARGDSARFRETLATSVRLTLLLTVPAAAALAAIGRPIVATIYERGEFTADMTAATAFVLALYAVGLPGYALVKVFVPTFYALGDPWTPVKISAGVVALKIGLNVVFAWQLGYPGLALATGVAAIVNAGLTGSLLVRRAGSLRGLGVGRAGVVACVSSLAMVAAVLATGRALDALAPFESLPHELARMAGLAVQIAAGLLVVAAFVRASGLPEAARLSALLGRRGGRR